MRVAIARDPGDLSLEFVAAHPAGAGYEVGVFTDPGAAAEWVEADGVAVGGGCQEQAG